MTLNPADGLEVDKAHLGEAQQLLRLDPSFPRGWGFPTNAFSIDWIMLPSTWKENRFCCMGTNLLSPALPTPSFPPQEQHSWCLCPPCRDPEPKRSVQHPTSSSWEEPKGTNSPLKEVEKRSRQTGCTRQAVPTCRAKTRQSSYQKSKYQSNSQDWQGCCYQLSNNRVVRRRNHRWKQLWHRTATNLVINTWHRCMLIIPYLFPNIISSKQGFLKSYMQKRLTIIYAISSCSSITQGITLGSRYS